MDASGMYVSADTLWPMTEDRLRRDELLSSELVAERELFRKVIGQIVRDERKGYDEGRGITQAELGRRVGVSRSTISQLELGNVGVGFDVLFGIFRAVVRRDDLAELLETSFNVEWVPIKTMPTACPLTSGDLI